MLGCVAVVAALFISVARGATLEQDFTSPPPAAKPYVWWHWMSSNVSEQGIDKDLAAMKDCGISGATICAVGSTTGIGHTEIANSPWPDVQYWSPRWWELVRHSTEKGASLGLDIGMHNCPGWSASGGPWITPELSMQKVVWSETKATGPTDFNAALAQPKIDPKYNFYRDIAVLAVPDGDDVKVADVVNVSSHLGQDGKLTWSAPAGNWTIYRFGHTTTGKSPHPMPDGVQGLECDKLSAAASEFHLRHVLDAIHTNLGDYEGKAFGHILFDSYEAGPQNWTEDFPVQFSKLRGYDPVPWLPVLAGRKLGGEALTKRFQWDMKQSISDLFVENNFATFARMLKAAGLRMCFEPYKGPFDTISAAAECDTPMGEFWTSTRKGIARDVTAAAQALGRTVVGAEAFTGRPPDSHFTETPGFLKACADGAMVSGVNQFYLHDWTMQPFDDSIKPGVAMGWWGTHFGRNQTWYEPGKIWYTYLARCSALLQRGQVVSDFCTLEFAMEGGDALSYKSFAQCTVENGQIVAPCGRRYALLVLPPDSHEMLPAVAEKIKQLVNDGANVLGPKPTSSPSLTDYPKCDAEVSQIANVVWGTDANEDPNGHSFGQGKVYFGKSVAEVLAMRRIQPDFESQNAGKAEIGTIHRRDGDTDIYFVANLGDAAADFTGSFRVAGKVPELWHADTGKHAEAGQWRQANGRTELPLKLGPAESVFVIFRQPAGDRDPVVSVTMPTSAGATTQPADMELAVADGNALHLTSAGPGSVQLQFASGRSKTVEIPALPSPIDIGGAWDVSFTKHWGAPDSIKMDKLASWSDSSDDGVKYFSGTGTYSKDIQIPSDFKQPGRQLILDLGDVKDLATVSVNGKKLGVLWHPPFRVDVTDALEPGTNHLEIAVTDTWRNRLIGDEQQPPDAEWAPMQMYHRSSTKPGSPEGRPLTRFPDWIVAGKPRPSSGRYTFTTWNYFQPDSKLDPAGLLGPVTLRAQADVVVSDAPGSGQPSASIDETNAIVRSEFIFEKAPFPSCHASTIAQTKHGLVAAWFGGTRERAPDVGIWVSRHEGKQWSPVVEVANGIQADGPRLPCWNPVLFQSKNGPLLLFYKVGPAPAKWWGMMTTSDDEGATWSPPRRLPDGILGPSKDKPIQLSDGTILCPSSTENDGAKIHVERTSDLGATWTKSEPLNDGKDVRLIQPTILDHGGGRLQMLCRSRHQKIYETWSSDDGKTWSAPAATELPNPNSGIDAVQLKDGRSLVVFNNSPTKRTPLNVAISPDGKSWKTILTLDDGDNQYSYPAVIQTSDGLVHITYTWKRVRIRHVVIDPAKLQ